MARVANIIIIYTQQIENQNTQWILYFKQCKKYLASLKGMRLNDLAENITLMT